MPKAKKLPSGSWRCRVTRHGVTRSFTVKDPSRQGKVECERRASVWAVSERAESRKRDVKTAVEDFIALRSKSLSVTTLNAYRSLAKNAFSLIEDKTDLKDADVQKWIDSYSVDHKPKTVANAYGLLTAALGKDFQVQLPKRKKPALSVPTNEEVKELLEATKGTQMHTAILLAAFGTLREGEVCAFTKDDIKGNTITVSKSMARDGNDYIIKDPKTPDSVRTVELSKKIIASIKNGEMVAMTPKQLSNAFSKLVKEHGMSFRFHDLRAYSASIRHALGIPDRYIMEDGGWKTDAVLKKVYLRALEDERKKFAKISNKHFDKML